ncbi:Poly-beta-1,6-N-acetyl-D-glucosamine N-deacetylase [invertebrate metagenome]|uniref:Poly-beta-1,6-N-acetyl-D-glucosamine N-deacetylase n=1 Tax=invertebrate metagenome TaxID=1711999 RepID=A0A2H9TBF9_9ZZZZ
MLLLLRSTIIGLLLVASFTTARETNRSPHAVILQYHHISDTTPPSTSVSPAVFKQHMDYLEQQGFHILSLTHITKALQEKTQLPDKTVAITFDDAFRNIYTHAYPILKTKNWPFTVFINTEPVDKEYGLFLNWQQLQEMGKNGATLANHSVTHNHLVTQLPDETEALWLQRIQDEITTAEARILKKTGQSAKHFAWPFGETRPPLRNLLTKMGYIGLGQQSGAAGIWSDMTKLPRYPMATPYAGMADFRLKINSLPLPIKQVSPDSSLITSLKNPPILTLLLDEGQFQKNQLRCYASDQGNIPVTWQDKAQKQFSTRATKPLSVGRSRYNCTAPDFSGKRYFWYSFHWLRLTPEGKAVD